MAADPCEFAALDLETQRGPAIEALNRAGDVEDFVEKRLRDLPIKLGGVAQARILLAAHELPGIRPGQLAKVLHQETHSVSGLLGRLQEKDLIDLGRDHQDRRMVHVVLTPAARSLVPKLLSIFSAADSEFGRVQRIDCSAPAGKVGAAS